MPRSRVPLGRRSRPWLALSGIAALAASGCAAPVPVAAVAQDGVAVAGPVKPGQKFQTYIKNGKLYCADCNTELNADGHHKASNLLIANLKALRTGRVLQLPQVAPGAGKLTLADTLGFTMARLGMTDIIKSHMAGQAKHDGTDPDAAVRLVPDYVGTYDEAVDYVNRNSSYWNTACCVPDGANTPDGPFWLEDALQGQSGPANDGTRADVEASGELVTLYKCFPFCSGVPALPDPPTVAFSGNVKESSQPDMGTGSNAGVPGALVQIRTTKDTPQIDLTTDGAGNYSGSFQPLADAPTATASKWGVSGLAGYAGPVTLYTDARTKLMLTPDSATGSNNVAMSLAGLVNGLPATGSKTIPFGSPTLIVIPRNAAGGQSTIAINSVDHPRYTWYGESALSLAQSAATGQVASGSMSVRTIYKYIKIDLNVVPPSGLPVPTDLELSCYTWNSVSYAGTPTVGTYNPTGLFGLPTAQTPSGALAQSNPTARGPASQPLYVSSLARLGSYQPRFRLHIDSKQMVSDPANGNEDIVLDLGDAAADEARRTGVFNKTIKLLLKDVAK